MNNTNKPKYVTLTFDIEDWFQVESFKEQFSIESWEKQNLRVEKGTEKILMLLDKYNIKATFFILGWIAERKPELVKKIYDNGHEVASHGFYHQLNYNMSKNELLEDLKKSKFLLEDIIDDEICGYRAPTFSVSDSLIELLGELNYQYDSSFNQFSKHDRYGKISQFEKEDNIIFGVSNKITEIAIPALTFLNQRVPIAGGGFFRLYPLWLTKYFIRKYFNTYNYYIFYAHPWEFDPQMPKVRNAKLMNRFRHYVNIKSNYKKMEGLINYLIALECIFISAKNYMELIDKGGQ